MKSKSRRVDQWWLSKTDVMECRRCVHGFLLLKNRTVNIRDTQSGRARERMHGGVEFDQFVRGLRRVAPPSTRPEAGLDVGTDRLLLNEELLVNYELRLRGIPDGVNMAGGRAEPLEIKNRPWQLPSDLIELAFYWLLLQPFRTVPAAEPAGWLILADENGKRPSLQRVRIPAEAFNELKSLMHLARAALQGDIEARWCNCVVCSSQPEDALAVLRPTAPVRLVVTGVGPRSAEHLALARIESVGELVAADQDELWWSLQRTASGRSPSIATIEKWQRQGRSFIADQLNFAPGVPEPIPDCYIALDIEYDSWSDPPLIWMACLRTVGQERNERVTVVADDQHQTAMLAEIDHFLNRHPALPVITWGGSGTELPTVRKAAAVYLQPGGRAGGLVAALEGRHLDMLQWTRRNVSLPIRSCGLKSIATYFDLHRTCEISDGLHALVAWYAYQSTMDPAIRDSLIDYSRYDVDDMVQITGRLKTLRLGGTPASPTVFGVLATDELHLLETAGPSHQVRKAAALVPYF